MIDFRPFQLQRHRHPIGARNVIQLHRSISSCVGVWSPIISKPWFCLAKPGFGILVLTHNPTLPLPFSKILPAPQAGALPAPQLLVNIFLSWICSELKACIRVWDSFLLLTKLRPSQWGDEEAIYCRPDNMRWRLLSGSLVCDVFGVAITSKLVRLRCWPASLKWGCINLARLCLRK